MSRLLIAFSLLLSACASEPPKPEPVKPVEPQVKFKQFPTQWNNGPIEYVIAVRMPDVKGKPKAEAEKIRKASVLNGLSNGLGVLFSVTRPDEVSELGRSEKTIKWKVPEYDANLLEAHTDASSSYRQFRAPADWFFSEIKEDTGKIYSTFVYAPTLDRIQARSGSPVHLDTSTNRISAARFTGNNQSAQAPTFLVMPNEKLLNLFQTMGPNVSPALAAKMHDAIEKKIEPYDIQPTPNSPDSRGELEDLAQREANDDEGIRSKKPRWLTHIDKNEGAKVWGYLMLYVAKIESQPKNDQGMVLFKITVDMNEVLKLAKAEKYDDYLAK